MILKSQLRIKIDKQFCIQFEKVFKYKIVFEY